MRNIHNKLSIEKKVGKLQIAETQFDQVDTAENNPL